MIDSIIIGNIIGENGLAAINLCMPVYLILCTFGSLFGSGSCLLSSVAIGENNADKSNRLYTLAIWMILGTGIVFTVLGIWFSEPITALLGVSGDRIHNMANDYIKIILLGSIPKMLLYIPFNYLRLDGRPQLVTITLLTMTAANSILDIILMIVFPLGMKGAATASALSSLIACVLGFIYLTGKNSSFQLIKIKEYGSTIIDIIKNGSPAAMNNFFTALRLTVLNIIIFKTGGSSALSVFAVVCSMYEFSYCILAGVPQTAMPIIGVYRGERDNESIRILMKRQFVAGGVLILIFSVLTVVLSGSISTLFGIDGSHKLQAQIALCYLAISLIFAMINSIFTYFFNATGRIAIANLINLLRVLVIAVLSAALLANLCSGVALWAFLPLSEMLTLLVTFIVTNRISRQSKALSKVLLLDDTLIREGKTINFSVEGNMDSVMEASVRINEFGESNGFTVKQQMIVSLAIEEMLTLIIDKCFNDEKSKTMIGSKRQAAGQTVDVRVFRISDTIGIRLRNGGNSFNPVAYYENNKDSDFLSETLGIKMITGLAEIVSYQRTFGVNSLIIIL